MYSKRRPSYTLSQNFLHNPKLIQRLVDFAGLKPHNNVLEIGAGSGQITPFLWRKVRSHGALTAVEIDPQLYTKLHHKFDFHPRLKLFNQDISCFDLTSLASDYVVVANLPFHLTSYVLTQLLEIRTPACTACHVVVQKEAAFMFGGSSLTKIETKKSMVFAPFYNFEIKHYFKPHDFRPAPQVDTVYLSIKRMGQPRIDPAHFSLWRVFVSALAQDRVGQGVWQQLFDRDTLQSIKHSHTFKWNSGISYQNWENYLQVFNKHVLPDADMMLRLCQYGQNQRSRGMPS